MPISSSDLEQELKRLPHRERARLAALLLASLEPVDEGNLVEMWLDEAERRLDELETGRAQAIPLDQVLTDERRG
jgi:putative addiction module component (TIGR02574 family)